LAQSRSTETKSVKQRARRGRSHAARDREFESAFLQQRVRLSPEAAFVGRNPRLSARVGAAGLATGSAATRRVMRDRTNRRQYLCRAIFQYRSAASVVGENTTLVPNRSRAFSGLIAR